MYKALSVLVESNYTEFIQDDIDFLTDARQTFRAYVAETDKLAKNYSGDELTEFLTNRNQKIVKEMQEKTHEFFGELYTKGINLSKLTFNMDANL
jgi:dipeptidase